MRFALLMLAACGSSSPPLCTTCLQVAGTWHETSEHTEIDCGDGMRLFFNGGAGDTSIAQTNARLDIGGEFPGSLHDDGSAEFGPIAATATSVDASSGPIPGKLRLLGWFIKEGAAMRFDGTYGFIADSNSCELNAPTKMLR